MSAYDMNILEQQKEQARVDAIKTRPNIDVMVGHKPDESEHSESEYWTFNMPEHILTNQVGPTARP